MLSHCMRSSTYLPRALTASRVPAPLCVHSIPTLCARDSAVCACACGRPTGTTRTARTTWRRWKPMTSQYTSPHALRLKYAALPVVPVAMALLCARALLAMRRALRLLARTHARIVTCGNVSRYLSISALPLAVVFFLPRAFVRVVRACVRACVRAFTVLRSTTRCKCIKLHSSAKPPTRHICAGTGLTPAHICAGTGSTPATSALGLGVEDALCTGAPIGGVHLCMEPVRSSTRVWVFPSRRLAERTAACTRSRWLTLPYKHTCAHTHICAHAHARAHIQQCIHRACTSTHAGMHTRAKTVAHACTRTLGVLDALPSFSTASSSTHSLECSPRSHEYSSSTVGLLTRAHSSGDSTARIWTLGNAPDARADSVVLNHIPRWASAMPHSASLVRFGHFREQGGARGL
jgi:hypothetical protein